MGFGDSAQRYGIISRFLHWITAVTVVALFALGLWMDDLGYYDAWYQRAPWVHKSVGMVLLILTLVRLGWRWKQKSLPPLPTLSPLEIRLAYWVHRALLVLLVLTMLAGYLISTADGRAIDVFNLFSVPATITSIHNQEDIAAEIHLVLAFSLVGLAFGHAIVALVHHFVRKDATLKRMLGR